MKLRRVALVALLSLCTVAIAFAQPAAYSAAPQLAKPIRDFSDLESGMPLDYVLANLRKNYELQNEVPAQSDDERPQTEAWVVLSGNHYVGELVFQDRKLWLATRRIWAPGQGEIELADRIFASIYDNSGKSEIEEGRFGDITRTRDMTAIIETREMTFGKLRERTLNILIGGKLFHLSLTTDPDDGSRHVTFDEVLVQAQSAPQQPKRLNK